jgi:hypothetical protein
MREIRESYLETFSLPFVQAIRHWMPLDNIEDASAFKMLRDDFYPASVIGEPNENPVRGEYDVEHLQENAVQIVDVRFFEPRWQIQFSAQGLCRFDRFGGEVHAGHLRSHSSPG